jgi:hypothetical protein
MFVNYAAVEKKAFDSASCRMTGFFRHFYFSKDSAVSRQEFEEYHRRLVAAQAIAGIKPNGEAEVTFYNTIKSMKEHLLSTLEWTLEDIKNKGDKNYTKHFSDGVE